MSNTPENNVAATPWEDLRTGALQAYDEAATVAHSWSSVIPRAINFYFDNANPTSNTVPDAPPPMSCEPASELSGEMLVQVLIENYARSFMYPDSEIQHNRWVECKGEVLSRLTRADTAARSEGEPEQEAREIETAYQVVQYILRALAGFNLPLDAMAQEALADGIQNVLQANRASAPATDEVADALAELREMFPDHAIWISASPEPEGHNYVSVCVRKGTDSQPDHRHYHQHDALTLAKAMQAVREWRAKEKL